VNYKKRQEKPEAVSSGFKAELPQASGSSTHQTFSNTSSGCLQDRNDAHSIITSNSMSLVPVFFLCVPTLF
jgi:hypothetical protein